jgi:hypothetical protein
MERPQKTAPKASKSAPTSRMIFLDRLPLFFIGPSPLSVRAAARSGLFIRHKLRNGIPAAVRICMYAAPDARYFLFLLSGQYSIRMISCKYPGFLFAIVPGIV